MFKFTLHLPGLELNVREYRQSVNDGMLTTCMFKLNLARTIHNGNYYEAIMLRDSSQLALATSCGSSLSAIF